MMQFGEGMFRQDRVIALATAKNNYPNVAWLAYGVDRDADASVYYVVLDRESTTWQNIEANPKVAFTTDAGVVGQVYTSTAAMAVASSKTWDDVAPLFAGNATFENQTPQPADGVLVEIKLAAVAREDEGLPTTQLNFL